MYDILDSVPQKIILLNSNFSSSSAYRLNFFSRKIIRSKFIAESSSSFYHKLTIHKSQFSEQLLAVNQQKLETVFLNKGEDEGY